MQSTATRQIRYGALILMVALFVVNRQASVRGDFGWCDDPYWCGPDEDCEKECWIGDPAFQNTCGGYGGVPVDPVRGNCLGSCGDTYCNDFNNEDAETCYSDCGECGDEICTEAPEAWAESFCCQDCGTCGTYGGGCSDSTECGDDLGCNNAGSCCTSIPVTGCGFCDEWENCKPWNGSVGDFDFLCVTKGATCNGLE